MRNVGPHVARTQCEGSHHAQGGDEEDFDIAAAAEHVLRERAHFVQGSAPRLGQPPQGHDVGLRRRALAHMRRLLHVALALEIL